MIGAAAISAVIMAAVLPAYVGDSKIVANTREAIREKGPGGYGKPLHGRIHFRGHTYPFVSGGSGRGSAPFGEYHVGRLSHFGGKKRSIPGYPLSDIFDPFVNDTRDGLYIHPGRRASKGCIAVQPDVWGDFVKDMGRGLAGLLSLGHSEDEPPWTEPAPRAKVKKAAHHRHRKNHGKHTSIPKRRRTAHHHR